MRAAGRSSRSTENEPLSPLNWTGVRRASSARRTPAYVADQVVASARARRSTSATRIQTCVRRRPPRRSVPWWTAFGMELLVAARAALGAVASRRRTRRRGPGSPSDAYPASTPARQNAAADRRRARAHVTCARAKHGRCDAARQRAIRAARKCERVAAPSAASRACSRAPRRSSRFAPLQRSAGTRRAVGDPARHVVEHPRRIGRSRRRRARKLDSRA